MKLWKKRSLIWYLIFFLISLMRLDSLMNMPWGLLTCRGTLPGVESWQETSRHVPALKELLVCIQKFFFFFFFRSSCSILRISLLWVSSFVKGTAKAALTFPPGEQRDNNQYGKKGMVATLVPMNWRINVLVSRLFSPSEKQSASLIQYCWGWLSILLSWRHNLMKSIWWTAGTKNSQANVFNFLLEIKSHLLSVFHMGGMEQGASHTLSHLISRMPPNLPGVRHVLSQLPQRRWKRKEEMVAQGSEKC